MAFITCERCGGGRLPASSGRVRCPECVLFCRRCDRPHGGDNQVRLCDDCRTACPRCGKPSVGPNRRCSACHVAKKRADEREAKRRLGDCCARCGITYPTHWDHINNDPVRNPARAKRLGVRQAEAAEIRRIAQTGRSDRLQLLCPNCNHLKQYDRAEFDRPPTYGPRAAV